MNKNPNQSTVDDATENMAVYAKTDMTDLVSVIKTIGQENKSGFETLTKLQLKMYNETIQKQNNELEAYRQGVMEQSKLTVLRAIAEIYTESCHDLESIKDPIKQLEYIKSLIEELLDDNDVQIVCSSSQAAFDRKFMKTKECYVIPTSEQSKDHLIEKSLKPGFVLFGKPLIQEIVSVYKYVSASVGDLKNETEIVSCETAGVEQSIESLTDSVSDLHSDENCSKSDISNSDDESESVIV